MIRAHAVDNDIAARQLRLTWTDGRVQTLSHAALRAACMCAACRAKRLQDQPIGTASSHIVDLHPQGYGLQFVFDDGHDRGIYPWQYLQAMTV